MESPTREELLAEIEYLKGQTVEARLNTLGKELVYLAHDLLDLALFLGKNMRKVVEAVRTPALKVEKQELKELPEFIY